MPLVVGSPHHVDEKEDHLGPLIEAGTGDVVRVVVYNRVANRSTTVHWHGLNQDNSTWMDGVADVSQCGVPPGQSFTYEFRVDGQRGTFWYHTHLGVQYTDSAYGPIVIRDPSGEMVPRTDEERILFVGDVYHTYGSVVSFGDYITLRTLGYAHCL